MIAIDLIEKERVHSQEQLDSKRNQAERNRLGQFATPNKLALDMLAWAKLLLPPRTQIRFLDPAFGTGAFYSALLRTFPIIRNSESTGYEVDNSFGRVATKLWRRTPLRLHIADFTKAKPPRPESRKANLIICNPPYVRHHHLTEGEKLRMREEIRLSLGLRLSGLTGLYGYFLCLAHRWMANGGLAGWLVPSEFMDVNYGREIKQYLTEQVTLLHIHRFDPREVQFNDALVSSAVLWFRKGRPAETHSVKFSYGGTLTAPRITRLVHLRELRSTPKWSNLTASRKHRTVRSRWRLSDIFQITRGVATGANGFFILSPQQVTQYRIPNNSLIPILPSPRHLEADEIACDKKGVPRIKAKRFLFSCTLREEIIKTRYKALWRYLKSGLEKRVNEGYLCRHRSPWYAQEKRLPAPILCTYMGREISGNGKPFRFILNHSKAIATNVYLMLYPRPPLYEIFKGDPEAVRTVWCVLNAIPSEVLIKEGRVYGGGLHKLEPSELANTPVDKLLEQMPRRVRDVLTHK